MLTLPFLYNIASACAGRGNETKAITNNNRLYIKGMLKGCVLSGSIDIFECQEMSQMLDNAYMTDIPLLGYFTQVIEWYYRKSESVDIICE
ncbi:MAG: hypothetical protein PHW03_09455 [Eubacteriales bacterium]|nr:hypothetical protein [Eubacteriales bacterium]